LQGPVPHWLGPIHRLQDELPGQSLGMGLQNGADVEGTHPADAQAIHLALRHWAQAVSGSHFDRGAHQGLTQALERSRMFFHRDHKLQATAQIQRKQPVIAADIGMTRAVDEIGHAL